VEALGMYLYDWENDQNVGWGEESGEIDQPPDPYGHWDDLVQLDYRTFQVRGWYHEKNVAPDNQPPWPPGLLPPPGVEWEYPNFAVLENSDSLWVKRVLRDNVSGQVEEQLLLYGRVQGQPGKKEYSFNPRTGVITFAQDPAAGPLAEGTIPAGSSLLRIEIQVRYKWRDNFYMADPKAADIVDDTVVADYATWAMATVRLSVIAFGPAESRPGEIRRTLRVAVRNARL